MRAWPSGQVVEVPRAPLQWPGFMGLDTGRGPTPLTSHTLEASHIQKNRGGLAQMSAQGKYSSAKRKLKNKIKWQNHFGNSLAVSSEVNIKLHMIQSFHI